MNREALRQQMLLRALWRDDAALQDWVRGPASPGLAAYRANAGALAERALNGAFATVAALIGADSFAALARHFWHEHPPVRGDIGEWGDALPAFIATRAQLADEPYLADSARLDWAVHTATRAADVSSAWPPVLEALARTDPATLHLQLAAGAAVITSRWPIVTVWQAHHGDANFNAVRAAFDAACEETALVWRDERFAIHVETQGADEARFTTALIDGRSLATALDAAGGAFGFDRWLERALRSRWLHAVLPMPSP